MDASLRTQDESRQFAMNGVRLFEDGSGGVCQLYVVAAPFSASVQFFFDSMQLPRFVDNLAVIERTLSGEARLGLQFEEPHIAFRGDGRGHVIVSGLLTDTREQMQRLEFCFVTDQTALGALISALREFTGAG